MAFVWVFIGLAIQGFSPINAAPSRRATSIMSDCTDVTLQGDWFVANCLTGEGSTRIQSTVYLPTKITNNEGSLQWKVNGGYASSCSDCKIIEGATLNCQCFVTGNASKRDGRINLEEHIKNYNGHLLSDLAGTPSNPTTSSIKIPSDVSWNLYAGGSSCYSTDSKYCTPPNTPSNLDCPASRTTYSPDGTPSRCWSFRIPVSAPIWNQFQSLSVDAPGKAYEMVLYDNLQCTGTPIGSVTPEEYGTCEKYSKSYIGVTVKPLWNADVS